MADRTKKAGQKKGTQEVQEVQEVINSTPAPKEVTLDNVFGISQADYLIRKAADYYNKPEEETTLQDAFDMMDEQSIADNTENLTSNEDRTDFEEATENIIRATSELTGKTPANVTIADLTAIAGNVPEFRLSDETVEAMSTALYAIQTVSEATATVVNIFSHIFTSPEFQAILNIAEKTTAFMADMATHSAELSEIANKNQEFTEETLPYIVLELADRTGEKDIQSLSFDDLRQFIDTSAEKPEKDLTPFEKEINKALDNFSFDGTPETDYARELLEAAGKRKIALEENKEVVDAITNISKTVACDAPTEEKARVIIKEYTQIEKKLPVYFPMIKGRPTDNLIFANKEISKLDKITGVATINARDVEIFSKQYEEVIAGLGIDTDKLLKYILYCFVKNNDFRHRKNNVDCSISFDLRDYAYIRGYDVYAHNNTDKEKRRANKQLDKVRKKVNKHLDILYFLDFAWKDPDNPKSKDKHNVSRMRLINSRSYIKNNVVYATLTPEYAQYLAGRNCMGWYPAKMFSLDGRNPTAYKVATKLLDHYFIDNNIINNTNDTLSIKALLPFSGLATFDEVQKTDRGHWYKRIKEPLEVALDELTNKQILSNWEYCHEKKQPLTDEEAAAIATYQDFEALYLHFTLYDELDQTERIEEKQQRIEAAKARKEKRKQTAIKRNIEKKADKEKGEQGVK